MFNLHADLEVLIPSQVPIRQDGLENVGGLKIEHWESFTVI